MSVTCIDGTTTVFHDFLTAAMESSSDTSGGVVQVFDNGELIQKGTHEELVRQKEGKYRQLWQAQAEFYEKKGSASQKI